MSKPTARMLRMLRLRLQKMRRRTSRGEAHTSSVHMGEVSVGWGGGGGKGLACGGTAVEEEDWREVGGARGGAPLPFAVSAAWWGGLPEIEFLRGGVGWGEHQTGEKNKTANV